MRRARERRRQHARLHNLIARLTPPPRGDYPGWPSDVVEVFGRHPEYRRLWGWVLRCWQWHPRKTNRPHWVVDGVSCDLSAVPEGTWLLNRVGDGPTLWGMLTPQQFKEWSEWRPTRVKPAA